MSEDAALVAPNVYTVLFENDRVRLLEGRVRPGESAPMHSHPAGLAYVVQGGKAKVSVPSRDPVEVELRTGHVNWRDFDEHAATNLGTDDIVVLFFEPK